MNAKLRHDRDVFWSSLRSWAADVRDSVPAGAADAAVLAQLLDAFDAVRDRPNVAGPLWQSVLKMAREVWRKTGRALPKPPPVGPADGHAGTRNVGRTVA